MKSQTVSTGGQQAAAAPLQNVWQRLEVQDLAGYGVVLAVGLGVAGFVWHKTGGDYTAALARYRENANTEADMAARRLENAFTQIYQNIRTISFLPGVRKIDRHATNLDTDGNLAIQQLYNNLASNIAVSEVYLVPASLDADKLDPTTGERETPIKMYDQVITDPSGKAPPEEPEDPLLPNGKPRPEEDETYEYRQFRDFTMPWFRQHYPDDKSFTGLDVPMLAGAPVVTCDNEDYLKTFNDTDRTGIMFSVPFYGPERELKGTVTAVVRNNNLQTLLPGQHFALINPAYGIVLPSANQGQQGASTAYVNRAEADPGLLFSRVVTLKTADTANPWKLWVGFPNSRFLESSDMQAIRNFRIAGYGLAGFLSLIGFVAVGRQRRYRHTQRLIAGFRDAVQGLLGNMIMSSQRMQSSSEQVTAIAEETTMRTSSVTDAAGNAAHSSSQIASAAEELSTSVQQVGGKTRESAQVVENVAGLAARAKQSIDQLAEKSTKVSEITTVITGIADQISLLALNASIEAARAGDAGMGFAVVASEVKNLATQVTTAADEITSQIAEMGQATQASVKVVDEVLGSINKVSENAGAMAAVIGEQATATGDIVKNISTTAAEVEGISKNIVTVQAGAQKTQNTAADVLETARQLDANAQALKLQIEDFLARIG